MNQYRLTHFIRVYYRMPNKRKGDLISLIMIFVGVVVFVPLLVKYLNSMFGNVVSGFQDLGLAGQGYSNAFIRTCRSPNPSSGQVCPEGTFCTGNVPGGKRCENISVSAQNGNPAGYMA